MKRFILKIEFPLAPMDGTRKELVTLGMFIIDTFKSLDNEGNDIQDDPLDSQVGSVLG